MNYDTELKNAYLIKFEEDDENLEIIWGIVVIDYKGRFRKEDYVCTTNIAGTMEIDGKLFVQTDNSIYKINNLVSTVTLPKTEYVVVALRGGISPVELIRLH